MIIGAQGRHRAVQAVQRQPDFKRWLTDTIFGSDLRSAVAQCGVIAAARLRSADASLCRAAHSKFAFLLLFSITYVQFRQKFLANVLRVYYVCSRTAFLKETAELSSSVETAPSTAPRNRAIDARRVARAPNTSRKSRPSVSRTAALPVPGSPRGRV